MKIPSAPNDDLLKSLVEETKALSRAAAAQARARQRTRTNVIRVAGMLAVSLLAAGIWFSQHASRNEAARQIASSANSTAAVKISAPQGYVKVYRAGEAIKPDPMSPDMSEREKKLLAELPGIPVLIVKNDSGQITRVHIFDR